MACGVSAQRKRLLKVVCVSDTHGLYSRPDMLRVPEGDVLVVAGDIELSDEHAARRFDSWLAKQPHKHKVVAFGNMDWWGEGFSSGEARLDHAQIACDCFVDVEGYRFFGSPWTPKFYGAFQFASEDAASRHWKSVLPPDTDVDVLITHGPPKGYGDHTKGRSVGDKQLLEAVQALHKPPLLWICGHIHESYGIHTVPHPPTGTNIPLINAAAYYLTQGREDAAPKVVELPTGRILDKGGERA